MFKKKTLLIIINLNILSSYVYYILTLRVLANFEHLLEIVTVLLAQKI
jgi:hypothetical protein